MICPRCKREHQNEKGKCPFCAHDLPTKLTKRQKEKPDESDMTGPFRLYTVTCEKCGQDVPATVMRFSGEAAERLGKEWVIPETHKCVEKVAS